MHALGERCPTATFAIDHQRCMIQYFEQATVLPGRKPAIGRVLGRKVARQEPPGNAAAHVVENHFDDLAQWPGERPARPLGRNQPPLCIRQIRFVPKSRATMLPASGWGLHRSLQDGLTNPLELRAPQLFNPFGTGSWLVAGERWQ